MSGWDEPATSDQCAYLRQLLNHRTPPAALRDEVLEVLAGTPTKRHAFDLIPRLQACPDKPHRYPIQRAPGRVDVVTTEQIEADDKAERDARREFSYQMYEANGEEYPGQMRESFDHDWLMARMGCRTTEDFDAQVSRGPFSTF